MFGVDKRGDPSAPLSVGYRVQRDRRFPGGFRAVHLDYPSARQATDAQGHVQCDGAGGNHLDRSAALLTEAHHRALAALLLDLSQGDPECLLPIRC
jgi:hypothetical protein